MENSVEIEKLIELCNAVDSAYRKMSKEEAQKNQQHLENEIRDIGQKLYDKGGEKLMLAVHAEVASKSSMGRYLEGVWDGIGTWQG